MAFTFEPDFQRVRTAVLCQGEPDRVPFLDTDVYGKHKERLIGHPVRCLADEIKFARCIGYDFVVADIGLHQTPAVRNTMKVSHTTDHSVDNDSKNKEVVERRWVTGETNSITNEEEFETFCWPNPDSFDYSFFDEADKTLPANMKIICRIGKIFNSVSWLMGFEQFSIALFENPTLIERMFDRVGSIQYRTLEHVLEHPSVGAYWHADDVAFNTATKVSPEVLRRYAFPQFRQMVGLAHDHGVLAIYHSDGKIDAILEDIIEIGFDGLNPIDPNALDIFQINKQIKGRISISGNIDLEHTLPYGTPEEVDEAVLVHIRELAPGGGYCLSSANSIPDYVPFENYIAMRDACYKYGQYPIAV